MPRAFLRALRLVSLSFKKLRFDHFSITLFSLATWFHIFPPALIAQLGERQTEVQLTNLKVRC